VLVSPFVHFSVRHGEVFAHGVRSLTHSLTHANSAHFSAFSCACAHTHIVGRPGGGATAEEQAKFEGFMDTLTKIETPLEHLVTSVHMSPARKCLRDQGEAATVIQCCARQWSARRRAEHLRALLGHLLPVFDAWCALRFPMGPCSWREGGRGDDSLRRRSTAYKAVKERRKTDTPQEGGGGHSGAGFLFSGEAFASDVVPMMRERARAAKEEKRLREEMEREERERRAREGVERVRMERASVVLQCAWRWSTSVRVARQRRKEVEELNARKAKALMSRLPRVSRGRSMGVLLWIPLRLACAPSIKILKQDRESHRARDGEREREREKSRSEKPSSTNL
jgi:hypothetical protein